MVPFSQVNQSHQPSESVVEEEYNTVASALWIVNVAYVKKPLPCPLVAGSPTIANLRKGLELSTLASSRISGLWGGGIFEGQGQWKENLIASFLFKLFFC